MISANASSLATRDSPCSNHTKRKLSLAVILSDENLEVIKLSAFRAEFFQCRQDDEEEERILSEKAVTKC